MPNNPSGPQQSSLPPGEAPRQPVAELARLIRVAAAVLPALGALAWLAAALAPDAAGAAAEAALLFVPGARPFLAPEPAERLAYMLICACLPFFILGAYALERRLPPVSGRLSAALTAAGAAGAAAAAALVFYASDLGRHFAAPPAGPHWAAAVAAAAGLTWLLWVKAPQARPWQRGLLWFSAAGYCLLLSASYRVFDCHSVTTERMFCYPFNAALYSAAQVMNGARLLTEVPAQYGLYALYLKPLFLVTGFSVLAFTSVMTALQLLCLAGFALLARRWLPGALLRTLFFLGLTYLLGGWYFLLVDWDPYYQYLPIRLLLPVLTACLVDWQLRAPGRRALLTVSFAAGLGLLWNLDSGLVACGAWLALLLLRNAWRLRLRGWPALTGEFGLGLAGTAAGALAAYLGLSAVNGAWLPLAGLFSYQAAFYGAGFNMLPMPPAPHPWLLVAGIYFGALVYGLRGAGEARPRPPSGREQFFIFLAVLGCGLFSYYQGRSHDFCLPTAAWPAWLLLLLAADKLGALTAGRRLPRVLLLPLAAVVFAAVAWSSHMVLNTDRFTARAASSFRNWRDGVPTKFTRSVAAVRERAAGDGRRELLILSNLQAAYYAETGLRSPFRGPSLTELLLREDAARLAAFIRTESAARVIAGDGTFGADGAGSLWGAEAPRVLAPLRVAGRAADTLDLVFLRSGAAPGRGAGGR